jgi:head-tail adaptor
VSSGFDHQPDEIPAGLLNRRVTLLSPNATADATGFVPRDSMTVVRSLWAQIVPVESKKSNEYRQSDREVAERMVIIRCRYLAAKDALESWWFQHTVEGVTEIYDIRAIEPVNTSRSLLQFTCRMVR